MSAVIYAEEIIADLRAKHGWKKPERAAPTLTIENQCWWAKLNRLQRLYLCKAANVARALADEEWYELAPMERGRVCAAAAETAQAFTDEARDLIS